MHDGTVVNIAALKSGYHDSTQPSRGSSQYFARFHTAAIPPKAELVTIGRHQHTACARLTIWRSSPSEGGIERCWSKAFHDAGSLTRHLAHLTDPAA